MCCTRQTGTMGADTRSSRQSRSSRNSRQMKQTVTVTIDLPRQKSRSPKTTKRSQDSEAATPSKRSTNSNARKDPVASRKPSKSPSKSPRKNSASPSRATVIKSSRASRSASRSSSRTASRTASPRQRQESTKRRDLVENSRVASDGTQRNWLGTKWYRVKRSAKQNKGKLVTAAVTTAFVAACVALYKIKGEEWITAKTGIEFKTPEAFKDWLNVSPLDYLQEKLKSEELLDFVRTT